jgi:hypothetical protein
MKNNIAFIKTGDNLTVSLSGRIYNVEGSHPNYCAVLSALKAGNAAKLKNLLDVARAVETFAGGKVRVQNGGVFFGNRQLHGTVVNRILSFMSDGLPRKPLFNFVEKLMQNPSARSVEQLYDYLELYKMPICEDGDFLAFKAVRHDFRDKHTGRFSNKPGNVLEMPRNEVDDDADLGCAAGWHCGAATFVASFGSDNDRFVLVKVNPRDVVSCPKDSSYQKLRVCRYEILREVDRDEVVEPKRDFVHKTPSAFSPKRDAHGRFAKKT